MPTVQHLETEGGGGAEGFQASQASQIRAPEPVKDPVSKAKVEATEGDT